MAFELRLRGRATQRSGETELQTEEGGLPQTPSHGKVEGGRGRGLQVAGGGRVRREAAGEEFRFRS